jgi:hypothetical protein
MWSASLGEVALDCLRWLAKSVRHDAVRSLQAFSGRVVVLLVLKHLSPERDHFGIEPSSLCRHLEPQRAVSDRDRSLATMSCTSMRKVPPDSSMFFEKAQYFFMANIIA